MTDAHRRTIAERDGDAKRREEARHTALGRERDALLGLGAVILLASAGLSFWSLAHGSPFIVPGGVFALGMLFLVRGLSLTKPKR